MIWIALVKTDNTRVDTITLGISDTAKAKTGKTAA
jgi:hypothetical protein